jgi:hypothetical protein
VRVAPSTVVQLLLLSAWDGEQDHESRAHPLLEGRVRRYSLIATIVAVGIILGLGNLRDGLNTLFNSVVTNFGG